MHIYQKKFARPTRPATALQVTSREAGIEEDSTSSPTPPPRKVLSGILRFLSVLIRADALIFL